jgi:hypothetical protein
MSNDPYYKSAEWRRICKAVRERSRGICEVPGCGHAGVVFDHVRARRQGGADQPFNVRYLCRVHDNQVMQGSDGQRKSGGKLTLPGCDVDGRPRDPGHWWNKER